MSPPLPVRDREHRRFLTKLLREVTRAEQGAIEHAAREVRRLGAAAPPARALADVAAHAAAMQPRFDAILDGHGLTLGRPGLGARLATLRDLVVDRVVDAERAYRIAVLDLRHGIDVVRLLREAARAEPLFGVIRWCDDWLGARRRLVAAAELELASFATTTPPVTAAAPAPAEAAPRSAEPPAGDGLPTSHDHR